MALSPVGRGVHLDVGVAVRGWSCGWVGVRVLMSKHEEDADGSGRRSALQGGHTRGCGLGAEPQGELPGKGDGGSVRRWPRGEAMVGHEPRNGIGCGGGFEPAHGSATSGARVQIFGEQVSREPRPPATSRSGLGAVLVDVGEQQQLVARCRRRKVLTGSTSGSGTTCGP